MGSLSIEFRIVRTDWSSRFLTKLLHSFLFNDHGVILEAMSLCQLLNLQFE